MDKLVRQAILKGDSPVDEEIAVNSDVNRRLRLSTLRSILDAFFIRKQRFSASFRVALNNKCDLFFYTKRTNERIKSFSV